MKKLLCIFLIISLVLPLWGCQEEPPTYKNPVNFYYPKVTPTFGAEDSLIAIELAEGDGFQNDTIHLLNAYIQGPKTEDFRNIFPTGTKVLALTIKDGIAILQVNKYFADLTGLNLSIACACLTLTVMDLTGAETVHISAKHANLDGKEMIVMDRNNLTLLDLYIPEPTE